MSSFCSLFWDSIEIVSLTYCSLMFYMAVIPRKKREAILYKITEGKRFQEIKREIIKGFLQDFCEKITDLFGGIYISMTYLWKPHDTQLLTHNFEKYVLQQLVKPPMQIVITTTTSTWLLHLLFNEFDMLVVQVELYVFKSCYAKRI